MKRAAAVVVLSLAACGSGDPPALFGGFTPTSSAAVILAPSTCNIAFLGSTAISGILVELASGADACNVLTQAKQCGTGASSTTLLAGAFSGIVGGSGVDPAGAGTYSWLPNPPTGTFHASTTSAAKVDASCTAGTGGTAQMSGGSVVISSVTASAVGGSMDMRFDNGQAYKGTFNATVCPVSIDICSLFGPCISHTCVP